MESTLSHRTSDLLSIVNGTVVGVILLYTPLGVYVYVKIIHAYRCGSSRFTHTHTHW